MKKTIRTILYTVVFAVLAVSCQKENNEVEPVGITSTRGTIEISINGLMGEYTQVDATKSSLVNNVRVSWEAGDAVYVYDGTQCLGSLVASLDGTEDRYAILSTDEDHTVTAPAAGTKLTLVHSPLLTEAPAVKDGVISISLAEQNGTKAPFVAYATLDYNNEESISNALVPFKFATSVIKVNCTGLNPNTAIVKASLSNVNTECKLTLSGTGAPTVTGDVSGNIIRTEDAYFSASKVNVEGEAVFQIAVPVLSAGTRSLTIWQGTSIFEDNNFSQSALSAATSVNTVCQLVDCRIFTGKFTVNEDGRKVYFSKGNLQAKYNGSSYSWGFAPNQYDIIGSGNENIASPVEGTALDLFGWSTASTCYGISTSKDNNTYKGDFVDWGTALGSNIWRTLSIEEWEYLIGSRILKGETESGYGKTCVLATINGASGLIVFCDDYTGEKKDLSTIPEGCVFLPAAGNRGLNSDTESQTKYENHGYIIYWSATPDYEASRLAYNFQLEPNPYDEYYYYSARSTRNFGYAVRLVADCE